MKRNLLGVLLLSTVLIGGPAFAKDGHGRGHHKGSFKSDNVVFVRDNSDVVIIDRDRDIIRNFVRERSCPPGLAKKHNGCLPPGHAKRFVVGDVLVERPRSIWHQLADAISPAPEGTRFVRVDNDVLLINRSDNRILDVFND